MAKPFRLRLSVRLPAHDGPLGALKHRAMRRMPYMVCYTWIFEAPGDLPQPFAEGRDPVSGTRGVTRHRQKPCGREVRNPTKATGILRRFLHGP